MKKVKIVFVLIILFIAIPFCVYSQEYKIVTDVVMKYNKFEEQTFHNREKNLCTITSSSSGYVLNIENKSGKITTYSLNLLSHEGVECDEIYLDRCYYTFPFQDNKYGVRTVYSVIGDSKYEYLIVSQIYLWKTVGSRHLEDFLILKEKEEFGGLFIYENNLSH